MKYTKLSLIIILLLFFADMGLACSLNELQQLALSNRQVVEKYKANLEREKNNVTLARSGYYPSLDASYTASMLDEETIFENKETSVVQGTVSWNLFSGFSDMYGVKSAKMLRDAEQYKLQSIKQDIQLNVALRYLAIYNAEAGLQVAEGSYKTLSKVYKDTENRFNVGLINKNELLKIKVDLDNSEINLKKAQAEVRKSIRLLQREINAEIEISEKCFGEFDQLPEITDQTVYQEKMLQQRSEIKTLKDIVTASEMQVKAERGGFYPKVDVASIYTKNDNEINFDSISIDDEEIRHQLTVSINLFDGLATKSKVSRARSNALAAKNDLAELKNDLTTELKNLFLDFEISKSNVSVAKVSIEQAEENLRITDLSYKEGLATTSDLLDAITNLSRAKFNHVSATSELFANYYKITRAVDGF